VPEPEPIKVYYRGGKWVVDYGTYVKGFHGSRDEAVQRAARAALDEGRELVIEAELGEPPAARRLL
jgi:hypothetical protein